MLIALSIMLLGGGSTDIWLFPEDFSDKVEAVVLEKKRQSEIINLFDKINESVKSHNDEIKELAVRISLLNKDSDSTEKEFKEVLKYALQKRIKMQTDVLDARMEMANQIKPNEWEQVFSTDQVTN